MKEPNVSNGWFVSPAPPSQTLSLISSSSMRSAGLVWSPPTLMLFGFLGYVSSNTTWLLVSENDTFTVCSFRFRSSYISELSSHQFCRLESMTHESIFATLKL